MTLRLTGALLCGAALLVATITSTAAQSQGYRAVRPNDYEDEKIKKPIPQTGKQQRSPKTKPTGGKTKPLPLGRHRIQL